nr:DUF6538 domain-containing protein [uncultured Paracoccus sp.]
MPTDLVQVVGTQPMKKSLGTKSETEAKRLLWPVIQEWQREFDDLRSRRTLVATYREHAVWDHYTSVLERDEADRARLPGEAEIEALRVDLVDQVERGKITGIDPLSLLDATLELQVAQNAGQISAETRRIKLAELKKHLAKGETALIAHEVDEYLRVNRLFVERSTADWISLARHIMRAEIQALERSLERDQGAFTGQPRDPLVKGRRQAVHGRPRLWEPVGRAHEAAWQEAFERIGRQGHVEGHGA